jgi:hypothetical protein
MKHNAPHIQKHETEEILQRLEGETLPARISNLSINNSFVSMMKRE